MVFSISAIIVVCSCFGMLRKSFQDMEDNYGEYQIQIVQTPSADVDLGEAQSSLPSAEAFRELSRNVSVEESKKIYACMADVTDVEDYGGKITEEYKTKTMAGEYYSRYLDQLHVTKEEARDGDVEFTEGMADSMMRTVRVVGCDIYPAEWVVNSQDVEVFYKAPYATDREQYRNLSRNLSVLHVLEEVLVYILF